MQYRNCDYSFEKTFYFWYLVFKKLIIVSKQVKKWDYNNVLFAKEKLQKAVN